MEEVEDEPATPGDDSQPQTPTVGMAKGPFAPAEMDGIDVVNGLAIPRHAGPPDEFGFRVVDRKPKDENDFSNNRILGPAAITWDEDEIGFRDSTNNPDKGATKARRGVYLGKANSHAMYYDRRCHGWLSDELDEGDFDQELVEKHGLHPRMGLFLPSSSNESEPRREVKPGDRPVVCIGPRGQIVQTSRSIWGSRLETETEAVDRKLRMRSAIGEFCQAESIPAEDIEPSQEVRDEHRRAVLAQGVDSGLATVAEESGSSALEASVETAAEEGVKQILQAASVLEDEDVTRGPSVSRAPSQSRPYDAIRDVFTDNAPPPAPARLTVADTYRLLLLAEIAEDQTSATDPATYSSHPPSTGMSMMDPRLMQQPQPGGMTGARNMDLSQPRGEYASPTTFLPPPPPPSSQQLRPQEPPQLRDNDFLRTALNPPPSSYPPIAPAPPARGPDQPSQRIPFSSPGSARGSLPALRPVRGILDESQQLPEPRQSPSPLQRGMVASNSGAYFPPAPARPFHSGYSISEQPPIPMPLAPMPPLPPPQPPLQPAAPIAQGQFTQSPGSYPMSPPSYQTSPPPMLGGPGPLLQQGQQPQHPPLGPPPASASPRARPGSSSASARYRKLEPAPTPAHRMGYPSNGQELRTVPFDYREAIKDYSAVEAPPRHGPVHIRGWTHNNLKRSRGPGKGDATAPEDPS